MAGGGGSSSGNVKTLATIDSGNGSFVGNQQRGDPAKPFPKIV